MRYEIEGGALPVAVVYLEPGESMVSEVGGRTWAKGAIETETKATGGIGKGIGRMFSGESFFMSHYTAKSAAEIAFTSSFPGTIVARELAAGESIICQKKAFLCATDGVSMSIFFQRKVGTGLFGGEGFIMQQITGPGTVFLELDGHCKEYDLAPGEEIVCDTGVVALMDATCSMDIRVVKGLKNKLFGGEGLIDTVVTGPGRVFLQSIPVPKLAAALLPYLPSGNK